MIYNVSEVSRVLISFGGIWNGAGNNGIYCFSLGEEVVRRVNVDRYIHFAILDEVNVDWLIIYLAGTRNVAVKLQIRSIRFGVVAL
jgi:hypothetical protein